MAFPRGPGGEKSSTRVVAAALRDLPSERVHKRIDERYPTIRKKKRVLFVFGIADLSEALRILNEKFNTKVQQGVQVSRVSRT